MSGPSRAPGSCEAQVNRGVSFKCKAGLWRLHRTDWPAPHLLRPPRPATPRLLQTRFAANTAAVTPTSPKIHSSRSGKDSATPHSNTQTSAWLLPVEPDKPLRATITVTNSGRRPTIETVQATSETRPRAPHGRSGNSRHSPGQHLQMYYSGTLVSRLMAGWPGVHPPTTRTMR